MLSICAFSCASASARSSSVITFGEERSMVLPLVEVAYTSPKPLEAGISIENTIMAHVKLMILMIFFLLFIFFPSCIS